MKAELLSKLLPKSLDMSGIGSGKSHDAITPQDISVILSYSKLTQNQTDFLLMKYLNDNTALQRLFKHFNNETEKIFNNIDINSETLEKIVKCAMLENVMGACPFCQGVGYTTFDKVIEDCNHCNKGVFIYDDRTKCSIMDLQETEYRKISKGYKQISQMIYDLEQDSLSKIGDT
tara:strand:+ start:972 stop:1496 length:525 start_codon:yes stop_codon:yes gene_type:complete